MQRALSGRDEVTDRRILSFSLLGAPIPVDGEPADHRARERCHGNASVRANLSSLIESGSVPRTGKHCWCRSCWTGRNSVAAGLVAGAAPQSGLGRGVFASSFPGPNSLAASEHKKFQAISVNLLTRNITASSP